jgi:hypothetical protein
MRRVIALVSSLLLVATLATPSQSAEAMYLVHQKTLVAFSANATSLTSQQMVQVRASVEANPNAEKFICTGIRFYDQPTSVNITVRKRAKAACEYAKELNPALSIWYQNKPTKARSYAGKVLLTVKMTVDSAKVGSAKNESLTSSKIVRSEFRTASNKKTGLMGKSWPVLRPQLASTGCSNTAIELKYDSGKKFLMGGGISYAVASPDANYGNPVASTIGYMEAYTRAQPLLRVGPTSVPIEIQVCVTDVPSGDEEFALVKVTLQKGSGSTFDGLEIRVDFAEPTNATFMQELKNRCLSNQNMANFPVAQVAGTKLTRDPYTDRITGTRASIEGTVFVNSVALKNVEIRFFQEFKNSEGALQYPGELIGKAKTDNLGQFEVSLPIKRVGLFGSETMVTAFVPRSVQPLGDGAMVIAGASFQLYFNWLLYPGFYTGNKFDVPPTTSDECSSAYFNYLDASSGDDDDERNRLARYIVLHETNRWFNGYKDANRKYTTIQCRDSSWGAACNYFESGIPAPKATEFGSLGSKCWHRQGHTRKLSNGKVTYVSAHKACRRT